MKGKKLQVFVSSTYTDLIEERQAAVEAILSAGHIPAGMELFTAGDESQMTVIKRWIDESDVYLLILGGRYGSLDEGSGKSYTHLEYDYALSIGKPIFSIVIKPEALEEKVKKMGTSATELVNGKELISFKEIVLRTLVKFWQDVKDIKLAIYETLSEFSYREELVGWIRGDQGVNSVLLAEEIARLTKENADLRERMSQISGADAQLYGGLTFLEMKRMLESYVHEQGDIRKTLFEFMMEEGQRLSIGVYSITGISFPKLLAQYGILQPVETTSGSRVYRFTENGQRFYLRCLHQLSQENLIG